MSRQAGSIVRGISKPRRISAISGPAAGGGYVLPSGPKVKVSEDQGRTRGSNRTGVGSVKINGLAGRSGRARTCDPRFWRPVLYQLSYTPTEDQTFAADPRRFKHRQRPDCKAEAANRALLRPRRPAYQRAHKYSRKPAAALRETPVQPVC